MCVKQGSGRGAWSSGSHLASLDGAVPVCSWLSFNITPHFFFACLFTCLFFSLWMKCRGFVYVVAQSHGYAESQENPLTAPQLHSAVASHRLFTAFIVLACRPLLPPPSSNHLHRLTLFPFTLSFGNFSTFFFNLLDQK